MTDEVITLRTREAPAPLLGKAWVVMLNAEFFAGDAAAACWYGLDVEGGLREVLPRP